MSVIQLNKHLKNNRNKMIEGKKCSSVVLKTRKIGKWVDVNTDEIFKNKKIILFSLPGAFTPVCSEKQLPGFEKNYDKLLSLGINEIYCISVNDGFVMNAWADQQKLTKVKVLPDGNADFTRQMGMLVEKKHVGFGLRSCLFIWVRISSIIIHSVLLPPFFNYTIIYYRTISPASLTKTYMFLFY